MYPVRVRATVIGIVRVRVRVNVRGMLRAVGMGMDIGMVCQGFGVRVRASPSSIHNSCVMHGAASAVSSLP